MTDSFALEKLNGARRAIAEAQTIPEAKMLLDQISVLADYAKRQRLELDIQNEVAECRIWTRRKLGGMLREMPKNSGGRPSLNHSQAASGLGKPPTLADLGIDKDASSRLQSEAEIPQEMVQEYIEAVKAKDEEVTVSGLNRAAKNLVSDKSTYDGDEWHTPIEYVEAAREVMGDIELDPAGLDKLREIVTWWYRWAHSRDTYG